MYSDNFIILGISSFLLAKWWMETECEMCRVVLVIVFFFLNISDWKILINVTMMILILAALSIYKVYYEAIWPVTSL